MQKQPEYNASDELVDNSTFDTLFNSNTRRSPVDLTSEWNSFQFADDDNNATNATGFFARDGVLFARDADADGTSYESGKTGSRGVASGGVPQHSVPYYTTTRHPRMNSSLMTVTNPMDSQRLFRVAGDDASSTWGYDNPVRSRVNKGLLFQAQRGAHPRHHTGAVLAPELTEQGMSGMSLGGESTRARKGGKRTIDILERTDSTYATTSTTYGGDNMGQQLAMPLSTAWRNRRMYADTQVMRPPSHVSDMAVLLDNPFVARNWNFDNLRRAVDNANVDPWD
jgi:hypothetical protein